MGLQGIIIETPSAPCARPLGLTRMRAGQCSKRNFVARFSENLGRLDNPAAGEVLRPEHGDWVRLKANGGLAYLNDGKGRAPSEAAPRHLGAGDGDAWQLRQSAGRAGQTRVQRATGAAEVDLHLAHGKMRVGAHRDCELTAPCGRLDRAQFPGSWLAEVDAAAAVLEKRDLETPLLVVAGLAKPGKAGSPACH